MSKRGRLFHEVGVVVDSQWQVWTYDHVNVSIMLRLEVLSRRLSQVVDATTKELDGAYWSSLRHFSGMRGHQVWCHPTCALSAVDWNEAWRVTAKNSTLAGAATDKDGNAPAVVKTGRPLKNTLGNGNHECELGGTGGGRARALSRETRAW